MAFLKAAPAATMALAIAGLLFLLAVQCAGASAVREPRGQRVSMKAVESEAMAATVRVGGAVEAVAMGEPLSHTNHCNDVPAVCTPVGWVVGNPFPLHPKNANCCKTIRNAGIVCLCKLWQVWNVPIQTVEGYRKDCKLSDSLYCP